MDCQWIAKAFGWCAALVCLTLATTPTAEGGEPRSRSVIGRGLFVEALVDPVKYHRSGSTLPPLRTGATLARLCTPDQPAGVGNALEQAGDCLQTFVNASAMLRIDRTDLGYLWLGESTVLRVERLELLDSGAKRTRLRVDGNDGGGGQVRFHLRPFNNPDSQFQLLTPAGTASVRGTIFGVSIDPWKLTAYATDERGPDGTANVVAVESAGRQVVLASGLMSLVRPGEPPGPPQAAALTARLFAVAFDPPFPERGYTGPMTLRGRTDPGNLLQVAGRPIAVALDGTFTTTFVLTPERQLPLALRTPLGKRQQFKLTVLLPRGDQR